MGLSDFKNAIITEDKFSGTFKKFDGAVQGSARGLDKLGGIMSGGGLGMLFGATAGVAGAVAIGKQVWALGELGAQSLTTKASFESLMQSVGQSPQLLSQMTAAAGGTITELQLMQQANTALAGTSGELANQLAGAMPQLIEMGRAAAMLNPSMGDAAFMTQSLITGIKRGSPMLIDNTGITLKLGEATQAYADSVGKSVNELTAQERSIAILNATLAGGDTLMQQVGGSLDSMTSDIQSANIALQELKTRLGEAFAPIVANAAGAAADALTRFADLTAPNEELLRLTTQLNILREHQQSGSILAKLFPKDLAADIAMLEGKIGDLNQQELETSRGAGLMSSALERYSPAADVAAGASANFTDQLAGLIATAKGGSSAMQSLIGYINGVSAAANASGSYTGFLGGVDVLGQKEYIRVTQDRINLERVLNTEVAAHIISQEEMDYQLRKFDNTVNDHISSLRDQGKAIADVGSSYDDLKSRISGALRPTFDLSGLTGGMLGGVGGDTFDEAYKRLAAVALRPEELQIHANDANWQDTFQKAGLTGLSPEDAQARAKELVEAYNKGLDFSLIDKEKIKDSIRQSIKADELFQSMVDEIYAEMGKPSPKLEAAGEAAGKHIGTGYIREIMRAGSKTKNVLAAAVAPEVAAILAKGDARYQ